MTTRLVEDLRSGDILLGIEDARFVVDAIIPSDEKPGPVQVIGLGFAGRYDGARVRLTYRHGCVPVRVERETS